MEAKQPNHYVACIRVSYFACAVRLTASAPAQALVVTENLVKEFPAGSEGLFGGRKLTVKAVDGVSIGIASGTTMGLVGESGSGKSTLGRVILRLIEPTSGRIVFDGRDLSTLGRGELRQLRREMQIVFQDPYASLNPRMRVGAIIGEGIEIHSWPEGREKQERLVELLKMVGLEPDALSRFPHEFSGGQRQRIGIARALAVNPRFLVLDEPVSALDVSIQAQIINLLQDLQDQMEAHLSVYRPRSAGGGARQPAGRDHVPGQDRGKRYQRANLLQPAPSLHARPVVRHPVNQSGRQAGAHPAPR